MQVLMRDGWRCHWCGAPANTVDHLRSVAEHGPSYDPSQLVASCQACNVKRGKQVKERMAKRRRGPLPPPPLPWAKLGERRARRGVYPGAIWIN